MVIRGESHVNTLRICLFMLYELARLTQEILFAVKKNVRSYEYTIAYKALPTNERFAFFQLNRPGPPQPIVIYDPYPLNKNDNEE